MIFHDIEMYPVGWRKGQTLFNFLEWLAEEKGYGYDQSQRMADPFYIEDKDWEKLYLEFMKLHVKKHKLMK